MPKCRVCFTRVGKNQSSCFKCGAWSPDPGAFKMKIGAIVLLMAVVLGLLFLAAREQMANAENRAVQQGNP